jgi:hypothetical protein
MWDNQRHEEGRASASAAGHDGNGNGAWMPEIVIEFDSTGVRRSFRELPCLTIQDETVVACLLILRQRERTDIIRRYST